MASATLASATVLGYSIKIKWNGRSVLINKQDLLLF